MSSSKMKSRWADVETESEQATAQRKREKDEKKRLKEEKLRKVAVAQTTPSIEPAIAPTFVAVTGESGRPAKRRKTSIEPEAQPSSSEDQVSRLLQFPAKHFGPCRDVEQYELLNNIEEGSYGMVSRARTKVTGEVVALKRLKMDYANDGFPVTGLREIQTLMASRHGNIVNLREVVVGGSSKE